MDHLLRPKLYNLSLVEQIELKKFIDENLKKGFIRESKSHMASPFFFIKKKNRKLRLVMDYWKVAFITNLGIYEPLVIFFGLTNSLAIFQTMINALFKDLIYTGKVAIYMDNILVFSKTMEEHIKTV